MRKVCVVLVILLLFGVTPEFQSLWSSAEAVGIEQPEGGSLEPEEVSEAQMIAAVVLLVLVVVLISLAVSNYEQVDGGD